MKLKYILYTTILLFLLTFSTINAKDICDNIFLDVNSGEENCKHIEYLLYQEVIPNKKCFFPQKPARRGEVAHMIVNAFNFNIGYRENSFTDIGEDYEYYQEILTLNQLEILNGYSDGSFKPYRPITRGEFMKILANSLREKKWYLYKESTINLETVFSDVPQDYCFREYISNLYSIKLPNEERIFRGFSDGTFKPDKNISKSSIAKIITNTMKYAGLFNLSCQDFYCSDRYSTNLHLLGLEDMYKEQIDLENLILNLGYSIEKRPILAHVFGEGCETYLFIGGIHGSEYNSSNLMKQWIKEVKGNQGIWNNKRIIIIPESNPDGLVKHKRLNSNNVDLNRNFDADWQQVTFLGNQVFSKGGGSYPFSEPETQVLRDFVIATEPSLIISYHSAAGFSIPNDNKLAYNIALEYSEYSGYRFTGDDELKGFDYIITGSLGNWAASLDIPAIVVELSSTHNNEFDKNKDAMWQIVNR
ncbi:DUF2817 domain-containing protein [Candidatus Dojkabacteria bacterium]|nr:DUF2817 domain-containing protein [Candidatus Dojkabacteria bacterium]